MVSSCCWSRRLGVQESIFYGVATDLSVLAFAVLIAMGAKCVGQAYNEFAAFENWARRVTGAIFILVGIYYCLIHIFGLFS